MPENPQPQQQGPQINFKATDEVMKGVYSNLMFASHNKEEFILDFLNAFGPQGSVLSKVIVSPGHFKRIVAALTDNLKKYEDQFGIIEQQVPGGQQAILSESNKFGF